MSDHTLDRVGGLTAISRFHVPIEAYSSTFLGLATAGRTNR